MSTPAGFLVAQPQENSTPHMSAVPVVIVDYGMGNLASVQRACDAVGLRSMITSSADDFRRASGVILPGVGAFGDAMEALRRLGLMEPVLQHIRNGKPLLGICLGMQLLMSSSEEFGHYAGLDVFRGTVIQFPHHNERGEAVRVPQVGWNTIQPSGDGWRTPLFDGITPGSFMYFVHSFRVVPEDPVCIVAVSEYEGVSYVSGIARKNVVAVQFHPEKSAADGLLIYRNWRRMIEQWEARTS